MSTETERPASIREVVERLEEVVDRCQRDGSRRGYFAALYLTVTRSVERGIEAGFFDDDERMDRFDVAFASHYFEALAAYRAGEETRRCWQAAFEACERWRPVVLQHLLLGMNAHINLDLGIATAETAPGDQLPTLRRDFDRINEILVSVMESIQAKLGEVSPWLGLLDRLGGRHDDVLINFSIEAARADAWWFATELAPLDRDDWAGPIRSRDKRMTALARGIARPGWFSLGLLPIRLRERGDVARVVEVLRRAEAVDFATLERRVRDREAAAGGPDQPGG
jgi:hypothetical protein